MPKIKPSKFTSEYASDLHDLWIDNPESAKVPDDIWHDLWVKLDEAYYLWEQRKSSALIPALEAKEMLDASSVLTEQEIKENTEDSDIITELLANVYFRNKDYEKAEPYLMITAREICGKDPAWIIKYAKCLAYFNDSNAMGYYDLAIKIAKDDNELDEISLALAEKARHFMFEGEYDEALALVNEAIETDPTSPTAYIVLGQIYHMNTKLELSEGLEVLENGVARCTDNCSILIYKGILLAEMGEYEGAIEAYEASAKLSVGDLQANLPFDYSCIADSLFKLGRTEEAIKYLDMAQELMDREGYVLNEYATCFMDSAFALKAHVMRELEEFDVESTDASSEDHEDSEEEEESHEAVSLKEAVEEAVASVKEEARTAVAEAKAALTSSATTSIDLQFLLSEFAAMKQELSYLKHEKTRLASDAESVRGYLAAKEAQKQSTKEMLNWIKSDPSLKEYYVSLVGALDEFIISAKAAKGEFVDEHSGTGIPGGGILSNVPFAGTAIGFIHSAIKGIQTIRTSNEASRALAFDGAETVTDFEKMIKKIAIEVIRAKYELIRAVTIDDEGGFGLLHKFSNLKAKFVEDRSTSASSKLGIQDAMVITVALKGGEFHGMTQDHVVATSIAYVTNADTQRGFFETISQGFALTTSQVVYKGVACDSDSSTEYDGGYASPGVLPAGYEVYKGQPMAAAGGSSGIKPVKKGGLISKLFKSHNIDPEFIAICERWDPENGFMGQFAFVEDSDYLDA